MTITDHQILAEVASLYYEEDLTQSEIAGRLGLSRVKVYRMLKQAKDEQVVQIVIDWPIRRAADLEAALCTTFGLATAHVLQAGGSRSGNGTPHGDPGSPAAGIHPLGQLAARCLEQTLQDGATLAVCLGRSTYETIAAIRPGFRARVTVAPALGALPFALPELDSGALARRLALKLGGDVLDLAAPALADSPADAAVLRSQREIRRTLDLARNADVALLGIGNLDPTHSGFVLERRGDYDQGGSHGQSGHHSRVGGHSGFLTPAELTALTQGGAVGDMGGHIFTLSGRIHDKLYDDRLIGLSLDDYQRIPITIAVAAGTAKVNAILGALRTGAITTLVTDDRTAAAVLALEKTR